MHGGRKRGRKNQDSNGDGMTLGYGSDRVGMDVPLFSAAKTGSREPPVFSAISEEVNISI